MRNGPTAEATFGTGDSVPISPAASRSCGRSGSDRPGRSGRRPGQPGRESKRSERRGGNQKDADRIDIFSIRSASALPFQVVPWPVPRDSRVGDEAVLFRLGQRPVGDGDLEGGAADLLAAPAVILAVA